MSFAFILFLFIGFRLVDWLISYLAPFFIPYLGFFPYKEIVLQYNLSKYLTALANFDGVHYLLIAKNGYSQYQQAFFPLYPLLIRWLSPLFFNNHLFTGIAISNVFFLFGLFIFSKYLNLISTSFNKFQPVSTILFLLMFPTSFFFSAVYTEGLFFFLFISSLYFLKKEKYGLTSIFAFLASLTKLIGVFLIVPFILTLWLSFLRKQESIKMDSHFRGNDKGRNFPISQFINFFRLLIDDHRLLIALIPPILGLTLYSIYLWKTTGDPLFFLHSQWAFGAYRSSNLIFLPQVYYRYLNIFLTANHNFQYFISLFEFITFNFVFIILILDLFKNLNLKFISDFGFRISDLNWDRIGLNLFSLINLLLPTLTGTFSSIPRYALFSLSFFLYLSQIKNISIKLAIAIIFVIFHILMLGFFVQGYFVS